MTETREHRNPNNKTPDFIGPDYYLGMRIVQSYINSETTSLQTAHMQLDKLIEYLEDPELGLHGKTKAVFKHCLRVEGDRNKARITLKHSPEEIFEKIAAFEAAIADPCQPVLLPSGKVFKHPPQLLEGEIEYNQTAPGGYWELTVGASPPIHIGNVTTRAIRDPSGTITALVTNKIEHIPIIGVEAIETYLRNLCRISQNKKGQSISDEAAYYDICRILTLLWAKQINLTDDDNYIRNFLEDTNEDRERLILKKFKKEIHDLITMRQQNGTTDEELAPSSLEMAVMFNLSNELVDHMSRVHVEAEPGETLPPTLGEEEIRRIVLAKIADHASTLPLYVAV